MRLYYTQGGIDTLDYAYDVSKGFGQGGPIGALGAAVKKGLEGLLTTLADTSPTGAPELNAEYLAKDKDFMLRRRSKVVDASFAHLREEAR